MKRTKTAVGNMDVIGTTTTWSSDNNKFLSKDNDDDEHSAIGNSSNSNSSSSDPPLSEYELLRLRNIQRNEARLTQLGLIVPDAAQAKKRRQSTNNGGGSSKTSALTLLLASPQQKSNTQNKRKRQDNTEPLPRRTLPKRRCTKSRAQGDDAGYASDESSVAASPIMLQRILTLQPHQAVAEDEDARPRRERRGRPRLEDYVYVCEERCSHCGGEWKLDGDEAAEEETKLIR